MGKSKKLSERLRQYYKGATRSPPKVANEEEMKVISNALLECLPNRSTTTFMCNWMGRDMKFKLVVGLSAGMRHLKRQQAEALILDSTAAVHLSNLLAEWTRILNIPIIIADRLINLAPKFGLKTLLVISLVRDDQDQDLSIYKDGDPRPKQMVSSSESDSFNQLAIFLQSARPSSLCDRYKFDHPKLVVVKSSGKSQEKKVKKKGNKGTKGGVKANTNHDHQQAHVV